MNLHSVNEGSFIFFYTRQRGVSSKIRQSQVDQIMTSTTRSLMPLSRYLRNRDTIKQRSLRLPKKPVSRMALSIYISKTKPIFFLIFSVIKPAGCLIVSRMKLKQPTHAEDKLRNLIRRHLGRISAGPEYGRRFSAGSTTGPLY